MPPKATTKDKSRMSKDGDEYEGETKNDKRHGRGVCKFSDGAVYDGMWKAGKMDGFGIYRMADGDAYEGQWKANKKDGTGTYHYASGRADVTRHEADANVGEGARWSAERDMAWRLSGGDVVEEISLEEAARIAELLNVAVPSIGNGSAEPPRHSGGDLTAAAITLATEPAPNVNDCGREGAELAPAPAPAALAPARVRRPSVET